ncbi:MAG: hypothetical protein M0C28_18440 [Candidatus Moduliflexus flocculans]|nr:hypothetical protein [Candidatus Moduliflexus flocculans]
MKTASPHLLRRRRLCDVRRLPAYGRQTFRRRVRRRQDRLSPCPSRRLRRQDRRSERTREDPLHETAGRRRRRCCPPRSRAGRSTWTLK